jgi:hypothetical protein
MRSDEVSTLEILGNQPGSFVAAKVEPQGIFAKK